MGIALTELPRWDEGDHDEVATSVVIGPRAKKPLQPRYPHLCIGHEFRSAQ